MMDELAAHIRQYCAGFGEPLSVCGDTELPGEYLDILTRSNGFFTHDGLFRFFGTKRLQMLPSIYEWNTSSWRKSYGTLFDGLLIIAEDVFGDQYGYDLKSMQLIKVFCEGGERQVINAIDLRSFLLNSLFVDNPSVYDADLIRLAFSRDLRPGIDEHLSFISPLVMNGAYNVSNLQIESTPLHLGVLGQLSLYNRLLPDGTSITDFA